MATPVQLQNLSPFPGVLDPTKFTHYNDGTTDWRVTVTQMQAIIMSALTSIAIPQPNDLMMVQQGSVTGKVTFSQVGFTKDTVCWFYQSTAPANWVSIGNGDTILAISGGSQAYNVPGGTTNAGTWQQADASLSISQIPAHAHEIVVRNAIGNSSNDTVCSALASSVTARTLAGDGSGPVKSTGSGLGHNHGNVWRPLASVGLLCKKMS